MAVLMSNQSGNFTTAATWSLIDSTSYSNSEAASTSSTTSWVASTTFVPGAITIDGLAIKTSAHTAVGSIAAKLGKSGSISSIATGSPGVITTSAAHGLTTGETILLTNTSTTPVTTALAWAVTVLSPTTFSLVQSNGSALNITASATTWSSATTYASGNTITYQGVTYNSLQNGNLNNTPSTSPTWWSSTTTFATPLATITSNTLVAAPVFTTGVAHGLAVGSQITIKGSTATPSFNGAWTVATVPSATTFTLTGAPSAVGGVSGWGAYNMTLVPDTVIAINASDLQTINTGTAVGWTLFKFPSNVTLTAATTYSAQITGSTAGNWTSWRTATAADWARALRTTTTQAPAAADSTLICGQYSSPGTNSAWTVTVDSGVTSATTYGGMEICGNGTVSFATSSNTYLKIAGNVGTTTTGIQGYTGGTFSMGTQASPVSSSNTAALEFACASVTQYGFDIKQSGFTFNTGGNALTYNSALLAADANAAATSLTTNVSTGWKNGNSIALASTTQTRTQCEKVALTADASGTTLTCAALANAHGGGGTALVIAEVINLSRNVSIFSTSAANTTYINIAGAGVTANIQATEFYNMGSNTAAKRGIDIAITTAGGSSCTINNCSIHDFTPAGATGCNVTNAASNNVTVSNTVFYNITGSHVANVTTSGNNYTYSNLIGILGGGTIFLFGDMGGTYSNLTAAGGTTQGIAFAETMAAGVMAGTISGLTAHSNTGPGLNLSNITTYTNNPFTTVSNITSWRNTTYGITFSNTFGVIVDGQGSNNGQLFGNATANMTFSSSCGNVYLRNFISNAGTTLTAPIGLAFSNDMKDGYMDNSTFGVTTTHATGDMSFPAANIFSRFVARNCTFNSATTVANILANAVEGSEISSARHQQTAGNHRSYKKFGTISSDSVVYRTPPLSTRLTPSSVNGKIQSGYKKIAVPNGQTATISVYVRKSVAGDGAAYNGNQPRLIQRADAATGNNTDVVLATATNAANGAFQLLTATIAAVNDNCAVTVYIDADGSAGWVNIDDWFIS